MSELLSLARRLRALPADQRVMLVVRSMPFGDIIEDDTRRVHAEAHRCHQWQKWAYRLCRLVK